MGTPNGGFVNAKQQRAIDALMLGMDITTAARVAGCSRKTIYAWMRQPAFAAALTALEAEAIAYSGRRLLTLTSKAVDFLEGVLDGDANPYIKMQAARLVLDGALKLRELKSVEERLAALEAAIHGKQHA